ncbi:ImmA/IrrE family metallo-endopeptidase [Chthonobacter albigriseus]|uniref:ImmA/IrrE family metallo-endopeptidase n=1 Tax=Chthonobacter albigriseus TaxID=1683161 RepID=UPI0015EFCD4A|nr:ImmA/IrrE family metallo-endopeptidase [Chthonobacter albigriseus]
MPDFEPVNLEAIALARGVKVTMTDLRGKYSAMMIRWDENSTEVRLEKRESLEWRRFALAKALVKLPRTDPKARGFELESQRRLTASDFGSDPALTEAMELLVPEQGFRRIFKPAHPDFARLATLYCVPRQAVEVWSEHLGLYRAAKKVDKPIVQPAPAPAPLPLSPEASETSSGVDAILRNARAVQAIKPKGTPPPAKNFGLRPSGSET